MIRSTLTLAFSLAGMLTAPFSLASEKIRAGEALFSEGRCMACHTDRPFGGDNSRVSSFKSLNTMVEACNTNLGLGWFPDEVEAVSHYLNHHYYKFPMQQTPQ